MGIPLPQPDPDPLPLYKGFFCAHVTENEVGSLSSTVFVHQQHAAAGVFTPLVSVDGGTLQPAWAGQRLHWVCGARGEGGAFFRVHSCGQLEFLGTATQPSPDSLGLRTRVAVVPDCHVSPGYVQYTPSEESEDDSEDEDGYHDAPAVYLGGESGLAPSELPSCLHCRGGMYFVGRADGDMFCESLEDVAVLLWYCPGCRVQCCLEL